MKSHKHQRSGCLVKSKRIVELEDDEDSVVQPLLHGVPEVVLPRLSTIVARTPNLPRSPRAPTKNPLALPGHPAVIEFSQPTPKPPVRATPVMPMVDILIPGPVKQPMLCLPQAQLALHNSIGQEDQGSVYVVHSLHDKEDQVHPREYGIPASLHSCSLHHPEDEVDDTIWCSLQNSLQGTPCLPNPWALQSSPCLPIQGLNSQSTQMRSRSKTITAVKPPVPAPAPAAAPLLSSRSAVPAAALGVPMPDLHAMSHVIRDAAAQITLLEARMAEQDESALPPLIDLSMETLAPTTATLTFPDASAIEGLLFNYDQVVHPED
ncbi:hypothetical protein BDR03DRAFT_1014604 [Suillus americanus]|nr:hypothetical protein BDR03DRAFT_1014604 [Suillus americanus]